MRQEEEVLVFKEVEEVPVDKETGEELLMEREGGGGFCYWRRDRTQKKSITEVKEQISGSRKDQRTAR